jgi:YD repeat-containing protein
VGITVRDLRGSVLSECRGRTTEHDLDLSNDIDPAESFIEDAFGGTIIRRTDYGYEGALLVRVEEYTDADDPSGGSSERYTTTHGYDALGRRVRSEDAAGTVTRTEYDVRGRVRKLFVGTDDGEPGGDMTLIEESARAGGATGGGTW